MSKQLLFSPWKLGGLTLANRVVMAPMTRNRSPGNVPGGLVAEYYAQRAEAGLIVTEGTAPCADGLGYARIPGLFDAAQVAGWRLTTSAVHARGGKLFIQLMHTGRASAQANLPEGARVLAPSAVALPEHVWVDGQGQVPATLPIAMNEEDIEAAIEAYARSADLALEAGFDGVELHAANGYLIDQFLNVASNRRTDRWGGSVENRLRFAVTVAERVAERIGPDRVGIRVSPYGVFNGMTADAETDALFSALAKACGRLGLAYVHVVDHSSMGAPPVKAELKQALREAFGGTFILSGGYDAARAEADLEAGKGDLVAFGRPFISNPRLPSKLLAGTELRAPDFATFYSPGPEGYTTYPLD
jgi:N-ethylmaleimide reductase